MKQILKVYAWVTLLVTLLLLLVSYFGGLGYVYLNWLGWQLQSNLLMLFWLAALLSLLMQCGWAWAKRWWRHRQHRLAPQQQLIELHPYEQLGVMWLLDADVSQRQAIEQVFDQSGLLQHVVRARLWLLENNDTQALAVLAQAPSTAFELTECIRIEILLQQHNSYAAFERLEWLQQQALSLWMQPLAASYSARLSVLWGRLALQNPWIYLRASGFGYLSDTVREQWLQQLLQQFEHATVDELATLKQRFHDLQPQLHTRPYSTQVLWLKLIARMPELAYEHQLLALSLLSQQFQPDVFYLWFQQQFMTQLPNYEFIEQQLDILEKQYPCIPVLNFARWHLYEATNRSQQAAQLLQYYPDHILMAYLRIKNVIKDDAVLVQQLNVVFANDADFLQLKI